MSLKRGLFREQFSVSIYEQRSLTPRYLTGRANVYLHHMEKSLALAIHESRSLINKSRLDIEHYRLSRIRTEKIIESFKASIEDHQQALSKMSEIKRNWI